MPHTAPPDPSAPATRCPACGGSLRFDPARQQLRCAGCGGLQGLPAADEAALQSALAEHDYDAALRLIAGREPQLLAQHVDCSGCGARTLLPLDVVAAPCPFCQAPLQAREAQSARWIRPHALLPFTLDAEAARKALRAWLASRWFAPSALKAQAGTGEAGRGVYLPAWTFDAASFSSYRGERGDDRTVHETRTDANGRQQTVSRTVTDWRAVSGSVALHFDDELLPASRSLPEQDEALQGRVPLEKLQPFDERYTAGFQMEVYQTPLQDAFAQLRQQRFEPRIEAAVRSDIGGHHQRITHIDTHYTEVRFRHLLLPAWLFSYHWKGKLWPVVVNGFSGKVSGQRPWSAWKIAGAVLAALLLAGALALLLQQQPSPY